MRQNFENGSNWLVGRAGGDSKEIATKIPKMTPKPLVGPPKVARQALESFSEFGFHFFRNRHRHYFSESNYFRIMLCGVSGRPSIMDRFVALSALHAFARGSG